MEFGWPVDFRSGQEAFLHGTPESLPHIVDTGPSLDDPKSVIGRHAFLAQTFPSLYPKCWSAPLLAPASFQSAHFGCPDEAFCHPEPAVTPSRLSARASPVFRSWLHPHRRLSFALRPCGVTTLGSHADLSLDITISSRPSGGPLSL